MPDKLSDLTFEGTDIVANRFGNGVHVRGRKRPTIYAVFDDIEPVSSAFTVSEFGRAIAYAQGYKEAKNRYQ